MSNIIGLCGSLRKESFNRKLLAACAELAPSGMTITPHDLSEIPLYNADVQEVGNPPVVEEFVLALRNADGILFCTPEYNRSVPGVLKNAIDWASKSAPQPFDDKPIAITGAARGALGTIMANHHLRQVLVFLNGRMLNGPEVLVSLAPQKFDDAGRLADEATREFVAKMLRRLEDEIARGRSASS